MASFQKFEVSDILKSGISLQECYKMNYTNAFVNRVQVESKIHRRELLQNDRRETKKNILEKKRCITKNMSPFNTPIVSRKQETVTVKKNTAVEKREDMLHKWKELKRQAKAKALKEKQKKPVFKVCHASHEIGLPKLDMINKVIKGKPMKLGNYEFKPPENVKPIELKAPDNKNEIKEHLQFNLCKKQTSRKVPAKPVEVPSTRVTRSQKQNLVEVALPGTSKQKAQKVMNTRTPVQKDKKNCPPTFSVEASSPKKKTKLDVKSDNIGTVVSKTIGMGKSTAETNAQEQGSPPINKKGKLVKQKTNKTTKNATSRKVERKRDASDDIQECIIEPEQKTAATSSRRKRKSKATNGGISDNEVSTIAAPKLITPNVKKSSSKKTKSSKCADPAMIATPKETKVTSTPVYISPFVTVSRGKDSARKEYHSRASSGGTVTPKSDFSSIKKGIVEATSPTAAAAYFHKILQNEISRITGMCAAWNAYKEQGNMPEEVTDMINVAIGQSQLLMSKKFQQFRGLIDRCTGDETELPVTCADLHGFWDMVYIQVGNLEKRFENLENLKKNNWEEVLPQKKQVLVAKPKRKIQATATSSLREAIKAARQQKKQISQEPIIEYSTYKATNDNRPTPLRSQRSRHSLLHTALNNSMNTSGRRDSSGLMMMKVTRAAKDVSDSEGGYTPTKSILKSVESARKSSRRATKAVIFEEDVPKENMGNLDNLPFTPCESGRKPRRSSRLVKSNLFDQF